MLQFIEKYADFVNLIVVSFVGAYVGYELKIAKTQKEKSRLERLLYRIQCCISSMFVAYLTFEISSLVIDSNGVRVALGGFASFAGTDFLVMIQTEIFETIKNKIRGVGTNKKDKME